MRSERGYSLVELVVVAGMAGIALAISVPLFIQSNALNELWTSSERVGALIRQTRLKAITRNAVFEVRFDCPSSGIARGLIMTGDDTIDNAPGRCSSTSDGDSEVVVMATGVSYDTGDATALRVTGRGNFSAEDEDGAPVSMPLTIAVGQGGSTRYLTVSITGQITFSDTIEEPEE